MRIARTTFIWLASALAAQTADAQQEPPCPSGPGSAFGVIAYNCANCSFKFPYGQEGPLIYVDGVRLDGKPTTPTPPAYSFNAEPVVLETTGTSKLLPGDVIVAVNGSPITTRSGADQFTYPKLGTSVITIRRGTEQLQFTAEVTSKCAWPQLGTRIRIRGNTGSNEIPATLRLQRTDTIQPGIPVEEAPSTGRFGFAVACEPSCTRARAADGTDYYKFDGYPPVVAVVENGIAAQVGMRKGDLIAAIDGLSILDEPGVRRFFQSDRRDNVQLTVVRDGKRINYLLRAR